MGTAVAALGESTVGISGLAQAERKAAEQRRQMEAAAALQARVLMALLGRRLLSVE